jgi:hypothetical protein
VLLCVVLIRQFLFPTFTALEIVELPTRYETEQSKDDSQKASREREKGRKQTLRHSKHVVFVRKHLCALRVSISLSYHLCFGFCFCWLNSYYYVSFQLKIFVYLFAQALRYAPQLFQSTHVRNVS